MILTADQIREVTSGAVNVAYTEGAFRFYRFNDREAEIMNHPFVPVPAGIQLNFKTDGSLLKLKVHAQSAIPTRSYFSFDIFVNDTFAGSIQNFCDDACTGNYAGRVYPLGSFCKAFPLGGGETYVRILLPHSVTAYIEALEIVDATYITPVKRKQRILFYGDSITQGFDALHPSGTYAVRLADALDAELINKGVGGAVFSPVLVQNGDAVNPDYIVVAYGTNDWNSVDLDTLRKNAEGFFQGLQVKYPHTPIFVSTPIWRPDWQSVKKCGPFSNVVDTLYEIFGSCQTITMVPGFDLMPHTETLFGDLCLHPSDKGFEFYAENLLKYFSENSRQ